MFRTLSSASAIRVLVVATTVWGLTGAHARRLAAAPAEPPVAVRPLLDKYCVTCHNDRLRTAGLSLEQAIADIAQSSDGVVGDEFRRVVVELEYGRWASVQEALGNLDRRNNVPELTPLSSQLQAAHAQGLPIMEVLAAQADSFRAQKKAALIDAGGKTTVKMVVPIAIFILPVLAIVILVPAVVQLMQIAE